MKHRKSKWHHHHHHDTIDSDANDSHGDNGKRRSNKHKAKFRSGFHHHGSRSYIGGGVTGSRTAAHAFNSRYKASEGYRSNPPYIQAHINFFDNDDNDGDTFKLNKFQPNGFRQSKWPNLSRLQSQLHQDIIAESLPPYVKKYNRRNKQLINLLEGTVSPAPAVSIVESHTKSKSAHQRRRQKNRSKWIEKNLFEEQRRPTTLAPTATILTALAGSRVDIGTKRNASEKIDTNGDASVDDKSDDLLFGRNVQSEPNALPGEHLSLTSEEDIDGYYESKRQQKQLNYPISPRADSFLFHRVASPKLVGFGGIGSSAAGRQHLPFVAITDKRTSDSKQRRTDTMQNIMPMP